MAGTRVVAVTKTTIDSFSIGRSGSDVSRVVDSTWDRI